jgi:hypothetical protein
LLGVCIWSRRSLRINGFTTIWRAENNRGARPNRRFDSSSRFAFAFEKAWRGFQLGPKVTLGPRTPRRTSAYPSGPARRTGGFSRIFSSISGARIRYNRNSEDRRLSHPGRRVCPGRGGSDDASLGG